MNLLTYIFAFAVFACVGSFIGVCADRIPRGEQIYKGRSHCDSCGRELKAWELIPILSFVFLGGRCRKCRKRIPVSSLLIELTTGVLGTLAIILYGLTVQGIAFGIITCILIEIAIVDHKTTVPSIPPVRQWLRPLSPTIGASKLAVDELYVRELLDGCTIDEIIEDPEWEANMVDATENYVMVEADKFDFSKEIGVEDGYTNIYFDTETREIELLQHNYVTYTNKLDPKAELENLVGNVQGNITGLLGNPSQSFNKKIKVLF